MKKLQRQIRSLQAQVADLQAFCGVLLPVFEREYKKGGWDWKGKKKAAKTLAR